MSLLDAASTWWTGHINAALIQTKLIDPINAFIAAFTDGGWTRIDSLLVAGYSTNGGGGGFQYHPAYKINGAGTVRFRGGIKKNSGSFASGSTTLITALPPAIVPAQIVEAVTAMDNAGGMLWGRMEITDTGNLNILLESSRGNWVSLDGIPPYDIA